MGANQSSRPAPVPGANEGSFRGCVALVTGAASGIGRATARALAEHGAMVAVVDVNADGAATVAESLRDAGHEAAAFVVDLADAEQTVAVVAQVLDRFGRVDILVNGAGLPDIGGVLDGPLEMWDRVYRVNVTAPFLLIKTVGRHMIERGGGGRIVNLSSSSGFRAHAGAAYGSSKAAIAALSRIAAAELAPHGINVNAVAPGLTRTPMVTDVFDEATLQAAVETGSTANFFRRPSEPEDIAAVVLFLCLPASRQMTAQTLHVSAGLVIS